jgi:hypothetical protein
METLSAARATWGAKASAAEAARTVLRDMRIERSSYGVRTDYSSEMAAKAFQL